MYKDMSALGQVCTDVGLLLDMVMWLGLTDLLHDGAEARDIGESILDLLNIMEKFSRNAQSGAIHQLCRAAAHVLLDSGTDAQENHEKAPYPLGGSSHGAH